MDRKFEYLKEKLKEPLFGNWRIDEFINSGSYAGVFTLKKGKEVSALKVIEITKNRRARKSKSSGSKSRLLDEIDILKKVGYHQNIIPFLDSESFEEDENIYILIKMQYISRNLESYISSKHYENGYKPNESEAIKYIKDVANGLAYIHSKNIIHRDIKPSNIFINENSAIIGDFGLSKECSKSMNANTNRVGTYEYMAPEVYVNPNDETKYDLRADIYSFGVVAYEILEGEIPYESISLNEYEDLDLNKLYENRKAQKEIEFKYTTKEFLKELIIKSTKQNPNERYESFIEIIEFIEDKMKKSKESDSIDWNEQLLSGVMQSEGEDKKSDLEEENERLKREIEELKKYKDETLKQVQGDRNNTTNNHHSEFNNRHSELVSESINKDVWLDPDTGLMWQNRGYGKNLTWNEAFEYAKKLNREKFGGYDDWRVPTIGELKTIMTKEKNWKFFIKKPLLENIEDLNDFVCWSSTEKNHLKIHNMFFLRGFDYWSLKSFKYNVLCVRK